jgi:hypothetical protein
METADGLGNEAQKRDYILHATTLSSGLQRSAMAHQASQIPVYQNSVSESLIDTHRNSIQLNPLDTQSNSVRESAIYNNYKTIARNNGASDEKANTTAFNTISQSYRGGLLSMLDANRYGDASKALEELKPKLTANDYDDVKKSIIRQQDVTSAEATGKSVAADLISRANLKGPSALYMNGVVPTESNGFHYDDKRNEILTGKLPNGQVPETPAYGISQMQLKTAENTANAHGIPWDKKLFMSREGQAYALDLGEKHFGDLYKTYDGDAQKAIAAYHMGEPALNAIIKNANEKGDNWIEHVGDYTKDYIAKVLNKSASSKDSLANQEQVNKSIDEMHPDKTVQWRRDAKQQASIDISVYSAAQKQQYEQAKGNVMDQIRQNNWSWSQVPSTLKNSLSSEDLNPIKNYADNLNNPSVRTNLGVKTEIEAMSKQELAAVNVNDFILDHQGKDLSNDDIESITKKIIGIQKGQPEFDRLATQNDQVTAYARDVLHIWPSNPEDQPTGTQKDLLAKFKMNMDARLEQIANDKKDKLTYQDIDKALSDEAKNFVSVSKPAWKFWGADEQMPYQKALLDPDVMENAYANTPEGKKTFIKDIPEDHRKAIEAVLIKNKQKPTIENVVKQYAAGLSRKN